MMRSNRNVWLALGASLLFSAAACSHNEPGAQQPTSSPPFESNVPSNSANQDLNRETLPRPDSDGTVGGMYGHESPDDIHSTDKPAPRSTPINPAPNWDVDQNRTSPHPMPGLTPNQDVMPR